MLHGLAPEGFSSRLGPGGFFFFVIPGPLAAGRCALPPAGGRWRAAPEGGRGWRRRGVGGWSRATIRRVRQCRAGWCGRAGRCGRGAGRFQTWAGRSFRHGPAVSGCRRRARAVRGSPYPALRSPLPMPHTPRPTSRVPVGSAPQHVPESLLWSGIPPRPPRKPLFPAFPARKPRHNSPESWVPLLLWSGPAPQQPPVSFPPRVVEQKGPHNAPQLPGPPLATMLWRTAAPQHHSRTALWSTGTSPGSKAGLPHHPGRSLPVRPLLPGVRNPG
ncbi:hypothetical protein BSTEL_1748 [Bifidobacterium stellenboschense]|uniref:Uncharacterized protein n=1 Tax=Bifidobacterium stellenboschense TaxID=762211 RepID=A0A087DMU0_9BIFI|nr:hypothetical protein BSTEL_1748 [Bifidobacterium stellenboschense]